MRSLARKLNARPTFGDPARLDVVRFSEGEDRP